MTLAEIAEASGIPARTIRFYIARGLLNGPAKAGRSAAYTAEHLDCLERIKHLQADGHTLSDIARLLSGASDNESAIMPATAWWQHQIADDVIVWVRSDVSPWRGKQLRSALHEFVHRLQPEKNGKGNERGTS